MSAHKRPTWVTVIGILGIIFGGFSILGGLYLTVTPSILRMQKTMFGGMRKSFEQMEKRAAEQKPTEKKQTEKKRAEEKDRSPDETLPEAKTQQGEKEQPPPPVFAKEMFKPMEELMDVPEWYGTWYVVAGLVTALIAGFYVLASIQLLQVKPWAVTLFYWASGASIGFSFIEIGVALSAESLIVKSGISGAALGLVIDGILLAVVVTSDKDVFEAPVLEAVEVDGDEAAAAEMPTAVSKATDPQSVETPPPQQYSADDEAAGDQPPSPSQGS